MRLLGIVILLAGCASAGEYAVLASGARLHVDRHEPEGSKVKLYNKDGYIELEAAQVTRFEPEEYAPPVAAASVTTVSAATAPGPVVVVEAPPSPTALADDAADRYGLPRSLVRSVMAAESGFQPQAVSPKGAIGLMQLMPSTASGLGANANDPAQNVDAGARYLRDLLEKYDGGLRHALAAYNAGPGAVDKYKGVPPYRETLHYVKRIEKDLCKSGEISCSTP
jgi:soluble lytic murein transglycosylase-like protein